MKGAKETFFRVVALWCVVVAAACGPKRGYEGPELPPEQIAQIRFNTPPQLSISRYLVDNKDASGGIDMLPALHQYYLEGRIVGEPQRCEVHTSFDSRGYRKCRKKEAYCDCFDYLTVYKKCAYPVRASNCRGSFTSKAGRAYDVVVTMRYSDQLDTVVQDKASLERLGEGSCAVGAEQWEVKDEHQGSGRSTAYQNGVTYCSQW